MDEREAGSRLVSKQKSRPAGDRAASENVLADVHTITANRPIPQPASVIDLRRAHVLARNVRPSLAETVAALAFGGRANG
jgi:hypothetical protein